MTGELRPDEPSRRDLLTRVWQITGILALGAGGFIGLRFLSSRSAASVSAGVIAAGLVDDFAPGTVTVFENAHFYLIRADDGGLLALYSKCPHLGCTVLWDARDDHFHCPCHGSLFTRDGAVLNPPAPRPLLRLSILIDDEGQVQVDTQNRVERAQVSPSDFIYPPDAPQAEGNL